ncbi:toll/interleukin-1 receptor domain-containing protein [Sphingomonas aurantiaca]|uniref:toll/interleukin-1 receptor domain-containing protein n=1 Tax=Sphingomonas aurantiaca TaxID=185949 RepID=UPI0033611D47
MTDIFISHASADADLARLLTRFLKEAVGVPGSAIFCSSVDGHRVPKGHDFNTYLQTAIAEPKLVLLLMTPSYMESEFCLMELGAAWAKGSNRLPIIVPPISPAEINRTLGLIEAWNITDHKGLIDLRMMVLETGVGLEPRLDHDWDDKRTEWRLGLRKLLEQIRPATKVSSEVHQQVIDELADSRSDVTELERRLSDLEDHVAKLKLAKDKDEVAAISRSRSGNGPQATFDALLEDVRAALPRTDSIIVKYILMSKYGIEGDADPTYRAEFQEAHRRNLIDSAGDVKWGAPKLTALDRALDALNKFLDSFEGMDLKSESTEPMEPNDLDFWEHHLGI